MRVSRKQRRARQRRLETENELKKILSKSAGLAAAAIILVNGVNPGQVYALPTGGEVVAGDVVINQAGKVMTIQQQTMQAILNWRAFGIAPGEHVNFLQPNANAAILNRVLGNNPSAIFGQLTSNGKVFLVNPNGVFFAPGAQVNVGGITASTLNITDANFMAKNYKFANEGNAHSVVNQGTIIAAEQGMVNLLAPEVKNEGVIVAKRGTVTLAAGDKATLDYNGDGKVQLTVEPGAIQAAVENKGLIEADGGIVVMTARANQDLTSSVVNQSGIIRARSLDGQAGAVTIDAGRGAVNLSGTVDVTSQNAAGGTVDIFGKSINMAGTAQIDASGDTGGGTVRVGGDWQGTGDAPHADTVTVAKGAAIHADAIGNGNGGKVVLWSDGTTKFDGAITAKGGAISGDGGKVETSGHVLQIMDGNVNASANNGKAGDWLLDPGNIEIVASGGTDGFTDSKVNVSAINTALNNSAGSTNVTIQAQKGIVNGTSEDGDITVSVAISKTGGSDATLSLLADGSITVNDTIGSSAGKLNVELNSGRGQSTNGAIAINANITSNGGWVKLHGGTDANTPAISNAISHGIALNGDINAGAGDITLNGMTTDTTNSKYGVYLTGGKTLTGNTIHINQNLNAVTNNPNGTVVIDGTIAAAGDLAITGMKGNSSYKDITLGSGANITAKNVTLTGDSMALAGSVSGSGMLAVKQRTNGTAIGIGGGAGELQLGDVFNGSVFKNFVTTQIGDANSGAVTVGTANFGGDVILQSGGAVTVSTKLNAGAHNVRLQAGADSTSGGAITAAGLDLQGKAFSLLGNNVIDTLTGKAGGVQFNNTKGFSVGSVTVNGISTDGLTLTQASALTAATGDLTIAKNITATNADLALTATSGALALANNAAVTSGSGDITLKAATALPMAGTIMGTGTLTIDNAAASGVITVGGSGGSGLKITEASFMGPNAVFGEAFKEVVIGSNATGQVNIAGDLTVKDILTVNSGSKIDFAGGALRTGNNEKLTLNAPAIGFSGTGTLYAGSGDLTFNTNSITGWVNANFAPTANGSLFIVPQNTAQAIYIGGTSEGDQLSVTAAGLSKISVGTFKNVTIGKTGGTGAVKLYSITQPSTNLTINGGAGTVESSATLTNTAGQKLNLNLASLAQYDNSTFNIGGDLALTGTGTGTGTGTFTLASPTNIIHHLTAANVGALEVWGDKLGMGANSATGNITIKTDQITGINGKIAAGGKVIIEKLTGADKVINIGTGTGGLDLAADWFTNYITGQNGIQIGDKTNTQTINIKDTTFQSALELFTKYTNPAAVNMTGNVTVKGNTTIYSWSWTLPTLTTFTTKGLTLNLGQGLTGIAGTVTGTGDLTIEKVNGKDIYLTNTAIDATGNYQIAYDSLSQMTGFGKLSVAGDQNIILKDGTLNQSTTITAGTGGSYGVTVDGAVNVSGEKINVAISGGHFTVNSGESLTVNSTTGTVSANAGTVELKDNAKIDVGGSNFTLVTNNLLAGSGAKIDGQNGALTVKQQSGNLYVGDTAGKPNTGLEITNKMLSGTGALFGDGFGNLTLGNDGNADSVTVNNAVIDNNVTILAGAGGTIAVTGTGGLKIDGSNRKVTLQGGKITNNGGTSAIDVGATGTIRLYTNDLSGLTGTKQVKGQGTLGIGSYDGAKDISLGNTKHGADDLHLTDTLLTTVFDTTFSKYDIGNEKQQNIYINNSTLGKDLILTAHNLEFKSNLTLNDGGSDLVLNAVNDVNGNLGKVTQSGGVIKVNNLTLNDGNFALMQAGNTINGEVATGDNGAHDIAVAGQELKLGTLTSTGTGDDAGNIELASNTMTFTDVVSGQGELYVHQTSGTNIYLGSASGTGLHVGSALFDGGTFKDGFNQVSLGNKDGQGLINIGGTLNFVDDTTIYGKTITTSIDTRLTTAANDLTLVTDNLDLSGGKISGTGNLTIQTVTQNRDLLLGQSDSNTVSDRLVLQSKYFQAGDDRVFADGYTNIILGRTDGTGTLYQVGSTNFTDNVIIRQGSETTGSLGFFASGEINTNGANYTVESLQATFQNAQVNTYTQDKKNSGVITIKTDKLIIDDKAGETDTSFTGGSGLFLNTYTKTENITLGGTGGNGLNLDSKWFGTDGAFSGVTGGVTIGGAGHTGNISLGSDFAVANNNLTLMTTGTVSGTNKLTSDSLTIAGGSVNLGAVDVGRLDVTSGGQTTVSGSIDSIGNITSQETVTIKDTSPGSLVITGTVQTNGSGEKVTISSGGNLELGVAGNIITNKGTVTLTADKDSGHFINNNTNAGTAVINTNGGHWTIFTYDSLGDNYGKLTGEMREYGTDTNYGTVDAFLHNGSAHYNTPVATIRGYKTYGDGNSVFFDPLHGFSVEVDQRRLAADKEFLGENFKGLLDNPMDSSQYLMMFLNEKTNVNMNIGGSGTNGTPYGTGNGTAGYAAGANPLKYKVDIEFWVKPKSVWVYANDLTKIYDKIGFSGNGFTYDPSHYFVNGQNETTAGVGGQNTIFYNNGGNAWGAVNVGDYSIGLGGNLTSANGNYSFEYKPGTLKITPKDITITASNAWRYYGQLNSAIIANGIANGLIAGDTISGITVGATAGQFDNAGKYLGNVTVNGYAIADGNGGKNYNVTLGGGDLKIEKRKLTITVDDFERIYGELDPTQLGQLTFKVGATDGESGLVNGDNIKSLLTWALNNPAGSKLDVGTLKDVINGKDAQFGKGDINNYEITYNKGDLIVTPRDVYVNAGSIRDHIYGEKPGFVPGYTIDGIGTGTGLVNGDSISGVTVGYADFINWLTNVGEYDNGITAQDATFNQGKASNYTVHYNPGMFKVNPRPVRITAGDANRFYGDLNPAVLKFLQEIGQSGSGRGLVNGDTITGVTQMYDPSMNQYTNVGSYGGVINASNPVLAPGVNAANYSFEYAPGTLTINKAKLMITADDKQRPYNTANPNFTVQYDGLKNGEKGEDVVTGLQVDTAAEKESPAGRYDITPGSADAQNYEISYTDGTLTVLPAGGLEAVDAVKDTAKPKPADPSQGTVDAILGKAPENLPPLMSDIDPNVPAMNMDGKVNIVDVITTADYPKGDLGMQVQGTSGTYSLYADRHGFGMMLDGDTKGYDPEHSRTKGAIPVLYTDYSSVGTDHEQTLDGFYSIVYTPERLSIEPKPQGETTPRRSEIKPDLRQDYSVSYQDDEVGTFQVAIGDGIVTIHPKDKQALDTVINATKAAQRAVLTSGVLRSVRDFGVAPDQLRAVYIFREILTLGVQARKG